MAAFLQEMLIGFPFSSAAYLGNKKSQHRYLPDPSTQYNTSTTTSNQGEILHHLLLYGYLINCLVTEWEKSHLLNLLFHFSGEVGSVLNRVNKLGRKTNSFATGLREHGMFSFYTYIHTYSYSIKLQLGDKFLVICSETWAKNKWYSKRKTKLRSKNSSSWRSGKSVHAAIQCKKWREAAKSISVLHINHIWSSSRTVIHIHW